MVSASRALIDAIICIFLIAGLLVPFSTDVKNSLQVIIGSSGGLCCHTYYHTVCICLQSGCHDVLGNPRCCQQKCSIQPYQQCSSCPNPTYTTTTTIPSESNLVAYYKFDEGTGITTTDSSGNGNGGTLKPSTGGPNWVDGIKNKALDFDGVNDYVDFSLTNFQNPTNQITVSAWVKINQMKNFNRILARDSWSTAGNVSWLLYANATHFIFGISNETIQYNAWVLGSANAWYYLTGVYNGTDLKLYLNGVLKFTTPISGLIFSPITYLRASDDSPDVMNGTIDDLRIYNKALTDAEVKQLYDENNPLAKFNYSNFNCDNTTKTCGISYTNDVGQSLKVAFYLLNTTNQQIKGVSVALISTGSGSTTAHPFNCTLLTTGQYNVMFQIFLSPDINFKNPIKSPIESKSITCP